jgi:5-formyltetrahydrofolate cyclo-ligase
MSKDELRRLYLDRRMALRQDEMADYNRAIHRRIFSLLGRHDFQYAHIFLPLVPKHEIDTWPVIRWLWKNGKAVLVPGMEGVPPRLQTLRLDAASQITEGHWGVPEPMHPVQADRNLIEVMLLPLVAFDKSGYRLGYGKGYYDFFIRSIERPVLKIGLSFFAPVEEIPSPDEWDVPLDMAVTPEAVFRF